MSPELCCFTTGSVFSIIFLVLLNRNRNIHEFFSSRISSFIPVKVVACLGMVKSKTEDIAVLGGPSPRGASRSFILISLFQKRSALLTAILFYIVL